MNRTWLTKHRRALTTTAIAIGLILAGRFAHGNLTVRQATYGFVPVDFQFGWVSVLRAMFAGVALLTVMWVAATFLGAARNVGGNGKASLGQGLIVSSLLWVASDKAEFDWRAIRITGLVLAGLLVASYLPMVVWENAQYAGYAILLGQVLGVFWVELFTEQPRWGTALGFLNAPEQTATPARGDYWRDAKQIRKGWDKLVQDLMSKSADPGVKVKAPKLIGDPLVDERTIKLTVEPPAMWSRDGLAQLAGGLTNEWNGIQSQIRSAESSRMSKRRMQITIAMKPLPEDIPYPFDDDGFGGVPLGEDIMGNIVRLNMFVPGYSHVLVAGQSGSGKTSGMRAIGLGLRNHVDRLVCIDPKGAGELEGVSREPTLFRPAEWRDWFDWLYEEQERRAEVKLQGGDFGRPIVTMNDEITQIMTMMGARDDTVRKHLEEAKNSMLRVAFTGRSVGIHVINGIQQASAEAMGGKMATAFREQHLGRILFGRTASKENLEMVLGRRQVTPQDVENMQEAPLGRAWVSGMTTRDTALVHCIQFFNVPEMAGGGGVPVLDRATPAPAPDVRETINAGSGEQDALRYLVADAVHSDGSQPRADLCTRFGVPVTTIRHALRKAEQAGWVRVESPGGNQPVVVHPVGDWPPAERA